MTEYPAWSTNANDTENTNEVQYRSNRQYILTPLQKDTPVKMPDYRQVLDNLETYVQDKLNITKSLNNRLDKPYSISLLICGYKVLSVSELTKLGSDSYIFSLS